MIRYLQLSLADLSANVKNILYKEKPLEFFLSFVQPTIFLQIPTKHILKLSEGLGKSTLTSHSLKASNGFI